MDINLIQSVCILGRQPALGIAELESLYGTSTVTIVSPRVAGLSIHASEINFDRLGGSTRVAHVLDDVATTDWKAIEHRLREITLELALTLPDGKIQLGLSAIDLKVSSAKLNATALTLKKMLRDRMSKSVRVTPNPEPELNTAQVLHNHLTGPTGIEVLLIAASNGHTILARTMQVQDITEYTIRDRSRPRRDARVGMLPPKLAQIIVNLATASTPSDHGAVILDPFCGTGVVLMEATVMGYDVYGSDIDPRMIEYTDTNLMWLLERPGNRIIRPTESESDSSWRYFKLQQGDATDHAWSPIPQVVASEAYLGRPFTSPPRPEVLAQTMNEVNLILKKFLQNIAKQLPSKARLCVAVPAWHSGNGRFKFLPLIDQIDNLGYNQVRFEYVRDEQLLYYREDQIVARQLLVLIRK